ncbi:hypothetical protein Tco_1020946, partial [Tanacetum coccineum]
IGPQSEFNLSIENKNQRPLEPLNRRYAFEEIRWRWWCWNQMAVEVVTESDGGGGAGIRWRWWLCRNQMAMVVLEDVGGGAESNKQIYI